MKQLTLTEVIAAAKNVGTSAFAKDGIQGQYDLTLDNAKQNEHTAFPVFYLTEQESLVGMAIKCQWFTIEGEPISRADALQLFINNERN